MANVPPEDDRLNDQEVAERLRYVRISEDDQARVSKVHAHIDAHVDQIVEGFYRHLESFPELRPFIADAQTAARLREHQRDYILNLGLGVGTPDYMAARLAIGRAHERIGIALEWYLGAYSVLLNECAQVLERVAGDEGNALIETLRKLFAFDAMLAGEAYHAATTNRFEGMVDQLSQAQEALVVASRKDELTGIFNRKYVMEALELEIYRSKRFNHPFTLLMLDIDRFKRVNDEYGHVFGDYALRTVAELAQSTLRPSNLIGRYGGEEFVIGLVECDLENAVHVAERIRLKIALYSFEKADAKTNITVSIGVAKFDPESDSLESLIERADKSLYRAKEDGRNLVRTWGIDPIDEPESS